MRNRCFRRAVAPAAVVLLMSGLAARLHAKEPKLKPEEVVARHLEALGSAEARAVISSRIASGNAQVKILVGGSGEILGPAGFVSQGRKLCLFVRLNHPDYEREQVAFDGEKPQVGVARPVARSPLGQFVHTYNQILREGLLGGALSSAWPLLDLEQRQPKLGYAGLEEVDDRSLHRLKYNPKKGGGDLKISLYFEPETGRHLLTIYKLTVGAGAGLTHTESAAQQEARFTLEERFGDFRQVDGLTLPTRWTLRLTQDTRETSLLWEWNLAFDNITHNQAIEPAHFHLH